MAEEKLIYRLTPCPARDMDTMEAWLEDMAAQGLFLTKDGFFCGFGIIFFPSQDRLLTRKWDFPW